MAKEAIKPTEPTLKELCEKLSTIMKSSVMSFSLPMNEGIKYSHLIEVNKLICKKECNNIIVVLHSIGGDANSTYQIVELLRNHYKSMITIIPLIAKSAATMFVLASDKIIMHEIAELGPLDTQIAETRKGARTYKSALNPFKTLEELQRFSLETIDVTAKLILERAYLSVEEVIKYGMDFAAKISAPLFSQLDTDKVGENSRALAVGKEYGSRLLKRYSKWKENDRKVEEVIERLIKAYPSHDYIIDYKEMQDIGFEVELPNNELKALMESMYECLLKTSKKDIFLVEEKKTEQQTDEIITFDEGEKNAGDKKGEKRRETSPLSVG